MEFPYNIGKRLFAHHLVTRILAKRLHKQLANGDIDGAGKTLKRLLILLKDQTKQRVDPSRMKGYSEARVHILKAKEKIKELPGAEHIRRSKEKFIDGLEIASDRLERLLEHAVD